MRKKTPRGALHQEILNYMKDNSIRTSSQIGEALLGKRTTFLETCIRDLVSSNDLVVMSKTVGSCGRKNLRMLRIRTPEQPSLNPFDWKNYVPWRPDVVDRETTGRVVHHRNYSYSML